MDNSKINQPFDDKKIIGIIAVLVLLGFSLILLTNYTNKILSGARTFIDGESAWSKTQKRASLSLVRYLQEEQDEYYRNFENSIAITEGYREANAELSKSNPDLDIINKGFNNVRNSMEDIEDALWIYQNFYWNDRMQMPTGRKGKS